TEISAWVYDSSGMEIPADSLRFDFYTNPRGNNSAQGRVGYRGPMQRRGDLPRIKLDLTDDEVLVMEPVMRAVHHPYSDRPAEGIHVLCYDFEEVFAEKVRALAERERPRDLYDVVHLYRREGLNPDRAQIMRVLGEKCRFKGIAIPSLSSLANQPERLELEADWEQMLAHQLPVLPPFQQFWDELGDVFEWLQETKEKAVLGSVPAYGGGTIDQGWQPPAMASAWHAQVPLEVIRFAAANRLCVNLGYQNSHRLIEPYSLRKTLEGNILLHAVRHADGEPRSYRIDRIQSADATKTAFSPRYVVELTASGPLHAPESERIALTRSSNHRSRRRSSGGGPTYVVECSLCGKKFRRKTNSTALKAHKDKSGYPCYGKYGVYVETVY
ncbi:MAG: nucleotidyl transferase AbiEii/AbiGii toxin family protein, partial [Pseudohongiellaceae bacterium]